MTKTATLDKGFLSFRGSQPIGGRENKQQNLPHLKKFSRRQAKTNEMNREELNL